MVPTDLIYGESSTKQCLGTVFLIHGFQDLSFGWRYQIPMLLDQGFRVAAIDCIGYGGTVILQLLLVASGLIPSGRSVRATGIDRKLHIQAHRGRYQGAS